MGDMGINFFVQYKPIQRSPIRHNYTLRNAIYLLELSYIPIGWRLSELLKTLRRVTVYQFISVDRILTFRLMLVAVFGGILGSLESLNQLHPELLKK